VSLCKVARLAAQAWTDSCSRWSILQISCITSSGADPDVTAALTAARAANLRAAIKHEPSGNHQERCEYLKSLAKLLPDDKAVESQLAAEKAFLDKHAGRASKPGQLGATASAN
jgi:hypothetical protein